MDGDLISGIMGLIGALVGGFLSYQGSQKGAEVSFNLLSKSQEMRAKKLFYQHLKYSLDKVKSMDPNGCFGGRILIYDKAWQDKLAFVDDLDDEEIKTIVTWYHRLEDFQRISIEGKGIAPSSVTSNGAFQISTEGLQKKVQAILEKYHFEP